VDPAPVGLIVIATNFFVDSVSLDVVACTP